jgi:hypothetical protein
VHKHVWLWDGSRGASCVASSSLAKHNLEFTISMCRPPRHPHLQMTGVAHLQMDFEVWTIYPLLKASISKSHSQERVSLSHLKMRFRLLLQTFSVVVGAACEG